jgi:hypothetical protein
VCAQTPVVFGLAFAKNTSQEGEHLQKHQRERWAFEITPARAGTLTPAKWWAFSTTPARKVGNCNNTSEEGTLY